MPGYRKLGRPTAHRKAMLRNLVTDLLREKSGAGPKPAQRGGGRLSLQAHGGGNCDRRPARSAPSGRR